MPKQERQPSKKKTSLVIGACTGLLLLLLVAFLCRGLFRTTILPSYSESVHGRALETAHRDGLMQVNKALEPLGLDAGTKSDADCTLDISSGFSTSIYCSADSLGSPISYKPTDANYPASILAVQKSMEADGWSGGTDYSGLEALYYAKEINGFKCAMQLQLFDYEQTLTGRLLCSQDYEYFGSPYGKY